MVTPRPAAWTVAIDADSSAELPAAYHEEETLLGEFLRTVDHYLAHADEPLNLDEYLPRQRMPGLAASFALDDPDERRRVLADVATLGVELLNPPEHRP